MSHELKGKSNEWYTPKYIFDAMEVVFDLDVAAPLVPNFYHVPCESRITKVDCGLRSNWDGFVWMNPPFGNQKNKLLWINKFIEHGNGIALMPDRSSASWWQLFCKNSDVILNVSKKIKFIRPDGTTGDSPSNGTTLFAIGAKGVQALKAAQSNDLGILLTNKIKNP